VTEQTWAAMDCSWYLDHCYQHLDALAERDSHLCQIANNNYKMSKTPVPKLQLMFHTL